MYNRQSRGSEELLLIYFSFIIIVCSLLVFVFYTGAIYKASGYVFGVKQVEVKKKEVSKDNNEPQKGLRVIRVNNSFNVDLNLDPKKQYKVKFPSAIYYFKNRNIDQTGSLYQYIDQLAFMLKRFADEKGIDSNNIRVLALNISDVAKINYSLQSLNDYNVQLEGFNSEKLSTRIQNYLEAIDSTVKQLQDKSYNKALFYSEYTKMDQMNYARNISQAADNIATDDSLHQKVKLLVSVVVDQLNEIHNNYVVVIEKENYFSARPVLVQMVKKLEIDHNIKNSLLTPLGTRLKDSDKAKAFIRALLAVTETAPENLDGLNGKDKQVIINAVNSVEIVPLKSLDKIIEFNLPGKYRCLSEGGSFAGDVCIFETEQELVK